MIYDYLIVGSGPSGGTFAKNLTAAGANVAVLEAGKRYSSETFPKNELDGSAKLFWGGGIEFNSDARLGFLRAKVLGGTSIVNQALLDRFDDIALDSWREESGVTYFSLKSMLPYYEKVEGSLSLQEITKKYFNKNTKMFTEAFDRKGLGWAALRRGQKDCALDQGTDCMSCLNGCPRNSKQSTLVTSLVPAEQKGLKIFSECEVKCFKVHTDYTSVFVEKQGIPMEVKTNKLILAAGSLGTTKILLASGYKEKLPRLGQKFSCHPQFMTYGVFTEPVDAHKGAFQAVKSYDKDLRAEGLKFENVFAPPIGTAMLLPGYGRSHHDKMKKYRYMASLEVALRDEASGEIHLEKSGKLRIQKKLSHNDQSRLKTGLKLAREMYQDLKAVDIFVNRQGFGLHLMGGATLGVSAQYSVVDPEFRLHGERSVVVADSSVFPNAPGINPSLTIMALSEMASEKLLNEAHA